MRKTSKTLFFIINIVIFIGITSCPIYVSAWGDSAGGRETHTLQEINENNPFGNTPVFDTIEIADTDYEWYRQTHNGEEIPSTTITDELNFVGARKDTGVNDAKTNVWDGNQIAAEDGETYVIRLYAHNNNPNGEDAVAENTKVSFVGLDSISSLEEVDVVDENGYPTGEKTMKQQIEVNGLISSSNASPQKYWDYVDFQSDIPFHLEYVYGSALLENGGFASRTIDEENKDIPGAGNGPVQLSDDIVDKADEGGTLIGYYGLDGRVPGCYQFDEFVSIRVKVVYDYDFTVENKVRLSDTKEWSKTVEAKVGDKVDFQIQYKNTSEKDQTSVAIKDTLPSNLRYVSGSTKIKNGNHKDGDIVNEDYLVTNGLRIGSYGPGANAYLMFTAEVVDDDLVEGSNTLVNWVQVGVGDAIVQDNAQVIVQKDMTLYSPTIVILTTIIILLAMILVLIYRIQQIKKNLNN